MPVRYTELTPVPFVSVLDEGGNLDESLDPGIPDDDLVRLFRTMILAREYDERRLRLQRQGRIGTFAPVKGQEAAQLGSAYALRATDWVVPAFRELAVALWRGAKLEDDLLYCAGYEEGVDLPEDARDLPINIPVASQIPHAVGVAWARKMQGTDEVAIVYFGDGATSEGDFHEAMNFAAVFQVPLVFLCQNNQWAISVPRARQTRSRTIAQKGAAYDVPSVQVDGNDLLAVYRVTRDAVARARDGGGPTFIEAVTYRLGVHTTADDPTKYRAAKEQAEWEKRDPMIRLRALLERRRLVSPDQEAAWVEEGRERIAEAVRAFESRAGADPLAMFDHLYATRPPYLERQRRALAEHLARTGRERMDVAAEKPEDLAGAQNEGFTGAPEPMRVGRGGGGASGARGGEGGGRA